MFSSFIVCNRPPANPAGRVKMGNPPFGFCRKRKNGTEYANITQHRLKIQSVTIARAPLENSPSNGYNKAVAREIHSAVTECVV